MEVYWVAAIGVGGALGGVLVQALLSRFERARDRRLELLLETYQSFLYATSELAAEARTGSVRTAEVWRNVIAAKQRILFFAPPDVVAQLAQFGRTSQIMGQPDADEAFAGLLKAMRRSLSVEDIEEKDLYRVLIGKDDPNDPKEGV